MDVDVSKLRLLTAIYEAGDDGHLFGENDFGVMIECVRRELTRLTTQPGSA